MFEELRVDIVGVFFVYRSLNSLFGFGSIFMEVLEMRVVEDLVRLMKFVEDINFWVGSFFYWVCKFKESNCLMLNILVEMYFKFGFIGLLFFIL